METTDRQSTNFTNFNAGTNLTYYFGTSTIGQKTGSAPLTSWPPPVRFSTFRRFGPPPKTGKKNPPIIPTPAGPSAFLPPD